MSRLLLAALLIPALFATPLSGSAQSQPQEIAELTPPVVWIPPEAGLQPIRLDSINIAIDVDRFVARTRMELVFANPNARILEGEFVFPLAPGLTVTGYELEVNGSMRAGVVVPKQTARVAFEDTIRQQIDPGLAELTQGNVFRTRLYPIPATGSKRIALVFEQVLRDEGENHRYVLPLHFDAPVRRLAVRAEARGEAKASATMAASPDTHLSFDQAGEVWRASFERTDVTPQRELSFTIPKQDAQAQTLVARDPRDPSWSTLVAQVDTGLPGNARQQPPPRRIVLYYDASASARERDRERELAVLERLLSGLDRVTVDLVAFRDAAEPPRPFQVRGGDGDAVLAAIRALPLDGGSSYGAIDFSIARGAGLAVVIGDGLSNFDRAEVKGLEQPIAGLTVHALHAAQRVDSARLAAVARRGGGELLDLLHLDAEQAALALRRRPWQLLAVNFAGADCHEFTPALPAPMGARVVISARCRDLEANARIDLQFGRSLGGENHRLSVPVSSQSVEGALAASVHRLWAQGRIAALDAEPASDVDAITTLATRYGVVSRHTSLLVLDRIEDYVRYRIEPPEAELRVQYHALLAAQPKPQVDTGRGQRLDNLAEQWRQFRAWHDQRHEGLEVLLLPTARAESARWSALVAQDPAASVPKSVREQAAALDARGQDLADRWREDADDAQRRTAWQREAGQLMLDIDAVRRHRLQLAPDSDNWPIATDTSSQMARGESGQSLDRIETIASVHDADMVAESAPPPPPSPPAVPEAARPSLAAAPVAGDDAAVELRAGIELSTWNPDTPYLHALRAAADPYAEYLEQRRQHGDAPAFFLDCADFLHEAGHAALAVRVVSNIAELDIENTALTRILGYRLAHWGRYELALGQFQAAWEQRPEEPQSHRDLALVLARLPQPQTGRAVELLWHVASGDWHGRFPGIELIALHELHAIVAAAPDADEIDLQALGLPTTLLDTVVVGLRVVLTWDADNTDIDLWVIDPVGDKAYYGRNRTRSGGHVSNDFTQGYGPEVFTIARPLPGTYRVQANYFGDRRQTVSGPVTVQVEFQTQFGASVGERQAITRRLQSGRETIDLGEFRIGL